MAAIAAPVLRTERIFAAKAKAKPVWATAVAIAQAPEAAARSDLAAVQDNGRAQDNGLPEDNGRARDKGLPEDNGRAQDKGLAADNVRAQHSGPPGVEAAAML